MPKRLNSFIQGKSGTITMIQVKPILTVVISQKTKCSNILPLQVYGERENFFKFVVREVMILEVSLKVCNVEE